MNKHKTIGYWRSKLYSYQELTNEQQINALSNYFNSTNEALEESFVIIPDHSPIPLCMFMKWDNKMFDGFYGTSYFDGYFIKFDKYSENALIVHRSW